MKTSRKLILLSSALLSVMLVGAVRADDTENSKAKKAGAVTILWAIPKEREMVTLLEQGKDKPIIVMLGGDSILGGICHDCHLFQTFKPGDAAKGCNTCACDKPNTECIAWKPVKPRTWDAMLQALPRGIALRVTYKEADKSDSGIKTLTVDHRTVLLPIEGLSGQTPDQLLKLVKPVGGVKAELVGDGKQLLIDLKEDWTLDQEAKFEKALAETGAKLTFDESKSLQK